MCLELQLFNEKKKRFKNITDVVYADNIALLANTPAKPETMLHSRERAAADIGLHVNTDKTEYMCFNQRGEISTLNISSLKLANKFTYQGSSVSSIETDTWLAKAWTIIDWLSVIWKSDLTDKIKRSIFQAAVVSILLYWSTAWTLTKRMEKNLDDKYKRLRWPILNMWWGYLLHKTGAVRPPTTHHEKYQS